MSTPIKIIHPICKKFRDLRQAAGLDLAQAEQQIGIAAIAMGSYERGDRLPPLSRIDAILAFYGYRLVAVPVRQDAILAPNDQAAMLRAIADQIDKEKYVRDVPELLSATAPIL